VKGGIPDPFDGRGSGGSEPSGFAVLVWAGVAGFAVVMATVAVLYGLPDRNVPAAETARAMPEPDRFDPVRPPLVEPVPAEPAAMPESGRTDIAGSAAAPGELESEIARLRIENAALRQGADALRSQMEILAERMARLEDKYAELTGSIDRNAPAPPIRVAPQGPPARAPDLGARPQGATGGTAQTRFGLELGAFSDLSALKAAWRRMLQQQPDLFGDLEALATVRDRGGRTELLLVAGPFPNAADAAARCVQVEDAGMSCLPAFFLGQALAIR
jgi:hypothetical protein